MPPWRFAARRLWAEAREDGLAVLREARALARRRWVVLLCWAVLVGALALWALPHDRELSNAMRAYRQDRDILRTVSGYLRYWGSFIDSPSYFLLLYAAGVALRRRRLRLAATALLIAALLSGAAVNVFRFTLGRPRPKVAVVFNSNGGPFAGKPVADRLVGPTLDYDLQSFPSGHSGTSVGGAAGLLVAAPLVGVPVMLSAAGIAWSSMATGMHYVTDVVVGTGMGLAIGVLIGLATRRRLRELPARDP